MIKIIGGFLKKSNINVISSGITKPTTNRVRENIFNIIQKNINSTSVVLDLFAGSGALGIESISRGADKCFFVEQNRKALKILNDNLDKLEIKDKSNVINDSADNYVNILRQSKIVFDIIFLDPPYKYPFSQNLINFIFNNKILSTEGIVVLQRPKVDIIKSDFIVKQKRYGENQIYILKYET